MYHILDRGDGLSGAISGVLSVACKFDGGLDNRHERYNNNIVISTHNIDQRKENKAYLHRSLPRLNLAEQLLRHWTGSWVSDVNVGEMSFAAASPSPSTSHGPSPVHTFLQSHPHGMAAHNPRIHSHSTLLSQS